MLALHRQLGVNNSAPTELIARRKRDAGGFVQPPREPLAGFWTTRPGECEMLGCSGWILGHRVLPGERCGFCHHKN